MTSGTEKTSSSGNWWGSGTAWGVWIALGTVAAHLATGWRYGFDRDELMALEDARHLAWGYVQYPPMTAFWGRVALELFGTSLVGFRFFAAVAMAVAVVLTGLMAKEMGGGKWAQATSALAAVPFCLGAGSLMQYMSFDYLGWVGVAYCMTRVASEERQQVKEWNSDRVEESENRKARMENGNGGERWWMGVGAGIGLGMLAKYTMGFLACGVVVG
ncbi:MAG: glycosyltransferase family 39 protein, partial [Candidatus Acidiferrum sp.]